MRARLVGSVVGGLIGFFIGAGTGIVGGMFGAVAGMMVFLTIGVLWGWSAGPDVVRMVRRLRHR